MLGSYKLKYFGLNFTSFLNYLIKNNLQIYNVSTQNKKEHFFCMTSKNYKKLKKLKPIYNVQVLKYGGIKGATKFMLNRMGLIVGLVIVLLYNLIASKKVLYIKVIGNNIVESNEIEQSVIDYGVKLGKVNNFDKAELEKYIVDNNSRLSMASIKLQGNSLIVNVLEQSNIEELYEPFYAPYNMLINSITTISGTARVAANSVVTKGSVLVDPFTINSNGERIECKATAVIDADVWFCGSEVAYRQNVQQIKTGNKKVYKKLTFSNSTVNTLNIDQMSQYGSYMTETHVEQVSKYILLPIYIYKTIVWETAKEVSEFDYDGQKENYIAKSKNNAYNILPQNVSVMEETCDIISLDDRYVFQTYLKAHMEIRNDS